MEQCPVCTLYLREGITLDAHLDTHPKDQVIRALCALSKQPQHPPHHQSHSQPLPPPPHHSQQQQNQRLLTYPTPPIIEKEYSSSKSNVVIATAVTPPFCSSFVPTTPPIYPRPLSRPPSFGGVVVLQPYSPQRLKEPPMRSSSFRILSDVKIEPQIPPSSDESQSDAFSVIKNVGNPNRSNASTPPSEPQPSTESSCEQPTTTNKTPTRLDDETPECSSFSFSDGGLFEEFDRPKKEQISTTTTTTPIQLENQSDDESTKNLHRYPWNQPQLPDFTKTENSSNSRDLLGVFPDDQVCTQEDALNIRSDERMPPRGELSEQESTGDADAPWIYRDIGGSTSYDLSARDAWPSDGSDIDTPPSLHSEEPVGSEDAPIVVSVKPPDKNYKCATCGKAFNCPKERRVHRTKEHPTSTTGSIAEKRKRKLTFATLRNCAPAEREPTVKTEIATSSSPTKMEIGTKTELTEDAISRVEVVVADPGECVKSENEPPDEKPPVKVETKKKRPDYSCVTCKLEFSNDAQYNEHLKVHPLECLMCGKLFNRRANLQLHVKRHLGIKNYKCDVCDKRFITKQKMIEHYNVHTGDTPIKCNLCDLTFKRHSNMAQHRNRHHFQIKRKLRDYVCVCGEVFHSKKKLAWHKEIHEDKPKSCLHCNEKFVHAASLTRHVRRAHNNYFVPDEKRKSENVECPQCNHVYLKSSIEMHMKTHTGSKPYSCVICNKSFTTKWNLKLHKWTHANRSSKPFKCNLCKGAFIRQADYVSHMNSHKSVRPYTCNYCGCQFIRKYNCIRHVREHENTKKYACEVPDCGKSFHRSYYLTEHLKVHSGVRPYSCNICGKTSGTKSNHNKHIKIHHAREPVTTEG